MSKAISMLKFNLDSANRRDVPASQFKSAISSNESG
jgi:hypothetical protein